MATTNERLNDLSQQIHQRIRSLGDHEEDAMLRELKKERDHLVATMISQKAAEYTEKVVFNVVQKSLEEFESVRKKERQS